jgi:hypothetical protein
MYKRPSILVITETKLGARQKITAQIEELETLSPNCAKYDVIHTLLSGMSRLFLILHSVSVTSLYLHSHILIIRFKYTRSLWQ